MKRKTKHKRKEKKIEQRISNLADRYVPKLSDVVQRQTDLAAWLEETIARLDMMLLLMEDEPPKDISLN